MSVDLNKAYEETRAKISATRERQLAEALAKNVLLRRSLEDAIRLYEHSGLIAGKVEGLSPSPGEWVNTARAVMAALS